MTTETQLDLHADLAICSAATDGGWHLNVANEEDCGAFYADDGSIVMDFGATPNRTIKYAGMRLLQRTRRLSSKHAPVG